MDSFPQDRSAEPQSLAELRAEVESLQEENERLRRETGSVAAANVEAALQLVEISEQRALEAERRELAMRRANEELREAMRRAEEAAKAKEEFVRTVSHEIRTPLNGILGMCALLAQSDLGVREREFADSIRSSSDLLLDLVNDILDFSKLESGDQEFEGVSCSLADVAAESVDVVASQAAEKGIELHHEVAGNLPEHVLLDFLRVKQVLINLLTNAVKFTDFGRVSLRVMRQGEQVRFEVEDTGVGIPKEQFECIFDPFSQADGSTTRRFGGTGLGLAIARRLADGMRGRIEVQSTVGQGSTFALSLPLSATPEHAADERCTGDRHGPEPEPPVARESSPNSAGSDGDRPVPVAATSCSSDEEPRTVLVVDDNETNRRVTQLLLESEGYEVIVAEDGLVGLELLASHPVDLVLLDFHMPHLDGHETARRMRRMVTKPTLQILGLTADMHSESDECGFVEAGANGVLFKPIQAEQLLSEVRSRVRPPSQGAHDLDELASARNKFFGLA